MLIKNIHDLQEFISETIEFTGPVEIIPTILYIEQNGEILDQLCLKDLKSSTRSHSVDKILEHLKEIKKCALYGTISIIFENEDEFELTLFGIYLDLDSQMISTFVQPTINCDDETTDMIESIIINQSNPFFEILDLIQLAYNLHTDTND